VDAPDGGRLVAPPARQAAEVEGRGVGPARPLLARPVGLVVDDRVERLRAEEVGDRGEDGRPPLVGRQLEQRVGLLVGHEADQRAARVLVVGVVVDLLHQRGGAEAGARQSLLAPERRLVDGVHLDDEAQRQVLVHLVLPPGQRRLEADAGVEVGRDGDDDRARAHGDAVGHRGDAVVVGAQRADGAAGDDLELGGHRLGHRLHAADHAAVEDEAVVGEVRERPRGRRHEDRLQGGERVRRLGEHAAGDEHADVRARLLVGGDLAQPVREGDGVELAGLRVRPGRAAPDLGGEVVEQRRDALHLRRGLVRHGRSVPEKRTTSPSGVR
jgi:hypothetical protein